MKIQKKYNEVISRITNDSIIQQVYFPEPPAYAQYASYDLITKKVTYANQIRFTDGEVITPPVMEIIKNKQVRFPIQADEYGDESSLISDIEMFIKKYLDLNDEFQYKLVCHYVLLTWIYDKYSVVPYLRAIGDYGTGKTRFAQVIGILCYIPLFISGATSESFIFRMIEIFKGTVIINELERINTDLHSQLVIILNNGYERGMGVGRVEGDKKREPYIYDIYCPKIITSRDKFKDLALESRIITVRMRPTKRKDIPVSLDTIFYEEAEQLQNKLLMYRFRNLLLPELEQKENKLAFVEPRLRQTLLPLLNVCQSEEVENEFIQYAKDYQGRVIEDRSYENDALIAEKLVNLLNDNSQVTVKDIAESVNKEIDEEKEKLSPKYVGKRIRSFGYETKKIHGVYNIIPNRECTEILIERYGLDITGTETSPQSPPSPPVESSSQVDMVDVGDISEGANQDTEVITPARN